MSCVNRKCSDPLSFDVAHGALTPTKKELIARKRKLIDEILAEYDVRRDTYDQLDGTPAMSSRRLKRMPIDQLWDLYETLG